MKIEKTWQEYWKRHKNHPYGMCFANDDLKLFYINIPKCATNWGKIVFSKTLEWRETNYHDETLLKKGYKPIVFLREPEERWATGMAEYFSRYGFNTSTLITKLVKQDVALQLINATMQFDEHTAEQIMFLDGVDTDNAVWFRVDQNLNQHLANYLEDILGAKLVVPDWLPYASSGNKKKIKQFFRENIDKFKQFPKHYKLDTELYNSVKYYNREDKD